MKNKNTKQKSKRFFVTVTGYDRWSGPEILYTREFSRRSDAARFRNKINGQNTSSVVPEYYEIARLDE